MVSAEEPSRSRLDECFLTECYLAPCQAHTRYCGMPPTCLASASAALSHLLTALKKKDTSTCLFWMSLWPHISARPQLLDGRRGRAIRPSCAEPHLHSLDVPTRRLGQAASALHSMAVLQVFQAKMLASEDAGLNAASLRDPRSATDLALRAIKATAQVVLEHNLWFTMTEMKEADKVPFLAAPVSSGSLFGPAVEGFAEHFTEAQKSSQGMQHFLPKCTSSSAASSHPRPAPI